MNRSTVYDYYTDTTADHTVGDLRSRTNAKSHAMSYLRYDRLGLLLQSTDINGVDALYSYDARGRVKTASLGGQSYRYDYWPDGQLQRVTAPDESFLDYSYDKAQRLTLIADKLGNQIQYGYDNLGNRVTEKTIDPFNRLTRQITRVFDALGRVQQTTGM